MLPDRVSNPGPLTYESGALLIALRGPALAEEEQELEALVESLDKTCTRYKIKISAGKTKLMTNSTDGIQRGFNVKGQKLDTAL